MTSQDTPSHLERALSLAEEVEKAGIMMKKIQMLAGAIALKLERGHQALGLLNNTPWDKNDAICDILVGGKSVNVEKKNSIFEIDIMRQRSPPQNS